MCENIKATSLLYHSTVGSSITVPRNECATCVKHVLKPLPAENDENNEKGEGTDRQWICERMLHEDLLRSLQQT